MKKDKNGPHHQALIESCKIEGVMLQSSPIVKYDAGIICEIKNQNWQNIYEDCIEHMFVIYDDTLAKRGWGMHKETTDRYLRIKGSIEVALFDGRGNRESETFVVSLSGGDEGGYSGIFIPPGIWHSFRNLKDTEIILMNFKSPGFNRDDVDKYLLPMPNELNLFQWTAI